MKKYLVRGGVLIFLIIVIFVIWQTKIIQRINQSWQERQFLNKVEKIKDEWRNDTVGGATPEETLKMFISAFKAEDLDSASKYFVVNKQAEFLAKMKNWVKIGKKEEIISRLEKTKGYGNENDGYFSFEAQIDGNAIPYAVLFKKNEFSQKWKISNM